MPARCAMLWVRWLELNKIFLILMLLASPSIHGCMELFELPFFLVQLMVTMVMELTIGNVMLMTDDCSNKLAIKWKK